MKLLFVGSPAAAATVLREIAKKHQVQLVITRTDSPVGRDRKLQQTPVADVAQELNIQLLKTDRITAETIDAIRNSNVERALVVAYGSLIPQAALDLMPWWNLHFSLLPLWRGATPLQHSLISGTGQGLSIFELDAGMDTGPLVKQKAIDLPNDIPAGELLIELAQEGAYLLLEALSASPKSTPQTGSSTLAPKISRHEARIDFTKTAAELQRMIFALNPEPMTWTIAGNAELRVLRAKALGAVDWSSLSTTEGLPGQLERRKNQVLVYCGGGSLLELLEVQPAGKKPMRGIDWARGFSGSKLG